ncbi:hypothetical protein ASPFODRAFT_525456 [Aspergillus luchuensis CBS 106.47]|uniref:Uncharacterized protein n=1 Tax=Aspergillus luchuensis (strain CBS 106.47) TaxID=1137211 RepID=A0A1M3TMW8_ASPLC|nr:hypothetical protein ASPFODRAFT_525456 [Aspergillus luchuensis CBS 106.47]
MPGNQPGYPKPKLFPPRGCRRQNVGRADQVRRAAKRGRRPTKEEPSETRPIDLKRCSFLLSPKDQKAGPASLACPFTHPPSTSTFPPNLPSGVSGSPRALPSRLPLPTFSGWLEQPSFFLPSSLSLHACLHPIFRLLISQSSLHPASHRARLCDIPTGPDVEAAFLMATYVFQICAVFLFGLV